MPHKLIFHPAIHFETDEALVRYESVSYELSLSFESELTNCYKRIADNPQYFFILHKKLKIRRASLKRFPYKLVFQIQKNNSVWIVSLAHHRRKASWRKRLK